MQVQHYVELLKRVCEQPEAADTDEEGDRDAEHENVSGGGQAPDLKNELESIKEDTKESLAQTPAEPPIEPPEEEQEVNIPELLSQALSQVNYELGVAIFVVKNALSENRK